MASSPGGLIVSMLHGPVLLRRSAGLGTSAAASPLSSPLASTQTPRRGRPRGGPASGQPPGDCGPGSAGPSVPPSPRLPLRMRREYPPSARGSERAGASPAVGGARWRRAADRAALARVAAGTAAAAEQAAARRAGGGPRDGAVAAAEAALEGRPGRVRPGRRRGPSGGAAPPSAAR